MLSSIGVLAYERMRFPLGPDQACTTAAPATFPAKSHNAMSIAASACGAIGNTRGHRSRRNPSISLGSRPTKYRRKMPQRLRRVPVVIEGGRIPHPAHPLHPRRPCKILTSVLVAYWSGKSCDHVNLCTSGATALTSTLSIFIRLCLG